MDMPLEIRDVIKDSVPSESLAGGYRCFSSSLSFSRVDEDLADFA